MIPVMQDAAAQALRDGLARFDGGRGWRDLGLSVDCRRRLARRSSTARRSAPAIPTGGRRSCCRRTAAQATIGFTDGSTGDAARVRRVACRSAASAARPSTSCSPGMVIIVKQVGGDSYALRSIPEVSGGMVAEEVHTGRVLAMQGGFDVRRLELQPRDPGAAPAGLDVQADRLCDRARERHDAGLDHRRCAVLRLAGRRPRQQMLRQFRPPLGRAADDALGRRAVAQPDDGARRIQIGMPKVTDTARKLGVGDYRQLSVDRARRRRHHGAADGQRLCDPRQPGRDR